jgi:hypothetical protein
MRSPVAHWGAGEWQRNMDDLVSDPAHPQAFPSTYPMDLMGRIRVRLCAEDGNLVAYGFGGQRVALSAKSVGSVVTADSFRTGRVTHGRALLVLDHENRILLRANGLWETYGEVKKVCHAAKLPRPTHVWSKTQRRAAARPPKFAKAPGYVRLRTTPRGTSLRVLGLTVLFALTAGLGGLLGVLPAVALPEWFGAVRTLIGIAGTALGIAGGLWAGAAVAHVLVDGVRWAVTSWAAGTPAPPRRFFGRRREHAGTWSAAANVGLGLLVVALIGWGPGVGIASLVHGFRDSSLVAELRAHGTTIPGTLIDVPRYSTDDHGNTTETDVPTLSFRANQTADPSIGGRPLALDASDPVDTDKPETVVYLSSDPGVAAARQQLTGSVWHGAPTANLVSGGLFTLALPPLIWFLVLRVRRLRWRRAKEFVDDLTA